MGKTKKKTLISSDVCLLLNLCIGLFVEANRLFQHHWFKLISAMLSIGAIVLILWSSEHNLEKIP